MIGEAITLGVLSSSIYDLIKAGVGLTTAKVQAHFANQGVAVSEEQAEQIINKIEADNLVQNINNGEVSRDNIESHFTSNETWQSVVNNINNHNKTVTNTTNITDSNVHSGTGDIVGGHKEVHHHYASENDAKKP